MEVCVCIYTYTVLVTILEIHEILVHNVEYFLKNTKTNHVKQLGLLTTDGG